MLRNIAGYDYEGVSKTVCNTWLRSGCGGLNICDRCMMQGCKDATPQGFVGSEKNETELDAADFICESDVFRP